MKRRAFKAVALVAGVGEGAVLLSFLLFPRHGKPPTPIAAAFVTQSYALPGAATWDLAPLPAATTVTPLGTATVRDVLSPPPAPDGKLIQIVVPVGDAAAAARAAALAQRLTAMGQHVAPPVSTLRPPPASVRYFYAADRGAAVALAQALADAHLRAVLAEGDDLRPAAAGTLEVVVRGP